MPPDTAIANKSMDRWPARLAAAAGSNGTITGALAQWIKQSSDSEAPSQPRR
jgi:hypothetical protein